jgi:hypothetical protein
MAITTAVYKKNINNVGVWSGADVIDQLEEAFTGLGWNSQDDQGGYIVGITTWLGGGTNVNVTYKSFDVEGYHSGVGTGAIFTCYRNSGGTISQIGVNHSGYGYTGGERITIPAESIDAPSGQDIILYPFVHSAMNGAVSYAITCSHTTTTDFAVAGSDRNGVVSGAYTTITIKEGDTIAFTNAGSYSGFDLYIINGIHNTLNSSINDMSVPNVINQGAGHNGEILTWTPLRGQAGEYGLRDTNWYLGSGQYEQANIIVQPAQDNDVTYPVIGTTTGFYDKNLLGYNNQEPFGILRNEIQPGKRRGVTYSGFKCEDGNAERVYYGAGPFYFPFNYTNSLNAPDASIPNSPTSASGVSYNGSHGYPHRWSGKYGVDLVINCGPFEKSFFSATEQGSPYSQSWGYYSGTGNGSYGIMTGNNTTFQLDLNVFRSSIDPNFAVLSYRAPTLSATNINGNTFGTFFLHKFNSNLWDLDHVFLGGHTQILRETSTTTTEPWIKMQTFLAGTASIPATNTSFAEGSALCGYAKYHKNYSYDDQNVFIDDYYLSMTHPYSTSGEYALNGSNIHTYYRSESDNPWRNGYFISEGDPNNSTVGSVVDSNAVLKGLPLSTSMMPVPYYLPDDFVMIQFYYGSVNANIQQGDTITVSPSEIYTVIAGSYNMTSDNVTRGVLFCGRKV